MTASISCTSDANPPPKIAIDAFPLSLRIRVVAAPFGSNRIGVRKPTGWTGDDDVARQPIFNESRPANTESSADTEVKVRGLRLLLLLTDDDELDTTDPGTLSRVYDVAISEIDRQTEAEKTRRESIRAVFRIIQWIDETWRPVGSFNITTTRKLDDYGHWTSTAVVADEKEFELWVRANVLPEDDSEENMIGGDDTGAAGAWRAAVVAGGAAALAALGAVAARAAQRRRRARRRRADVVLDARDFTFPLDEPRRVGDGMEAMLSCWLQQLHEFGGPELERPDLLKRAPSNAPSTPAAPSSVCNVSHAVPDRRVRFKVSTVTLPFMVPSFEIQN